MSDRIYSHRDLIVYQKSFAAGRRIFELSQSFPREEMYSLTDQLRRSARSVSANIAEAWRKRRYENHFCSTLNISEAEAAETQVWLEYAAVHGYLDQKTADDATEFYEEILRMIVAMIVAPDKWCIAKADKQRGRKIDKERGKRGVKEEEAVYLSDEFPLIDQSDLLSLSPPPRVSPSETPEAENA
ncbi:MULTISPECIES: four helix bundle protein [Novipirellula]|uniref:Four helix bundle protein n=1 Tax=Novipirellula rosea TaxID=1031540 RepID=A0ABP8MF14_9BACT